MIENIAKQINSFISALKSTYSEQGQIGKILFPGLFLIMCCFLCSILISLPQWGSRNASNVVPSPNVFPSEGTVATPTALFNFGTVTFAPFPTFPVPSALPTLPPSPTATQIYTPTLTAATGTAVPTVTVLSATATAKRAGSVLIVAVNKPMEYVDIQNASNAPVDLSGWRLVSETGNQACTLSGVLQPNDVLRVWSGKANSGFSCGFSINIWNDNQTDPAVLYNPQGKEISRSP